VGGVAINTINRAKFMHPFERLEQFSERNGIGYKITKNARGWEVLLLCGGFRSFKAPTLSGAVNGAIHEQETGSKLSGVGRSGKTKVQRGIVMSEHDGASPLLDEREPDGIGANEFLESAGQPASY